MPLWSENGFKAPGSPPSPGFSPAQAGCRPSATQQPACADGAIGYVVSRWPRLSQTFVLNEILALERRGVALRIFSTKDPEVEPIHADVACVQSRTECLSLTRWKNALGANLQLAITSPFRYFSGLRRALRYRDKEVNRGFFQAAWLAARLRREPVRHLHAHFATRPTVVAMFASELAGIPYTFTTHAKDLYVDTSPDLLRAEIRRAHGVITVSEYNRAWLAQHIDPSANGKVRCIYNGLDIRQFPHREPHTVVSTPLILSVGRLIEKKGFGDLIKAAQILRGRGRSIRVEIIGDGSLRSALEEQIGAAGLSDCVHLKGPQTQEAVRAAYRRADIFALPCNVSADGDRDGTPTVLLEAMASGLACVSTTLTGIPELIRNGENGLLTPPGDIQALAYAIELLIDDPGRRGSMGRRARETVEERFSIDRAVAELIQVFGGPAS